MVQLRERRLDLFSLETAARDSRLVGHHEHQLVVQRAQLFGYAGQQFDYNVAVGVERYLARLVQLDERAAQIEEKRRVTVRIGHEKRISLRRDASQRGRG